MGHSRAVWRLLSEQNTEGNNRMSIIWTIIIGFVAGVVAKLLHPGPNEPSGFILTTLLGIAGAFVATFLGQAIGPGRVRPDGAKVVTL